MTIKDPLVLLLIPVFLFIIYFLDWKRKNQAGISFSSGKTAALLKESLKVKLSKRVIILRAAAVCLIIFALARPQSPIKETEVTQEGVDIVLAIDVSTSMLAEDFILNGQRQNRLDVVKEVVKEFISKRHSDRIGIVVFGSRPYTVSPLTLDYSWLLENLERVKIAMVEDGTAVGSGISAALNRLKGSKAKSKIIILLTDGINNAGKIPPLTAAAAARALKVKVYTIGAGSEGPVPYPFKDVFGNTVYKSVRIDLDEATLKKIAERTKAQYYRAVDTESLRHIYDEIDKLEKTEFKEKGYMRYKELFAYFLFPGIMLILLEVLLTNTIFRRIP